MVAVTRWLSQLRVRALSNESKVYCIHTHTYTYTYTYTHTHNYTYTYTHTYTHAYLYIYVGSTIAGG